MKQSTAEYILEENIPFELQNSAMRIMDYADLPQSRRLMFMSSLEAFRKLPDKSKVDAGIQRIKEVMIEVYLETYQAVLKKAAADSKPNHLIYMFLNYGYMDEQLLTGQQTHSLYELAASEQNSQSKYPVYNMEAWMNHILSGEGLPSINEHGLDYYDLIRDKIKVGQAREEERVSLEQDLNKRLVHECNGLLRLSQRLCFGRMGGYMPILHSDMINGDISRSLVTAGRIADSLNSILAVDYSAFHREIVYNKPEMGISKEIIMLPVMPEIILVPTFGSRAVMWQELGGKRKDTPGRFLVPILSAENLDKMIIDLVAKFRWELSRKMTGFYRKDSNESSLAHDFTYYIQFHKNNQELSREAKDKIKELVKRNRSNIEAIFAADYFAWINYESKGLTRLNQVAWRILFKHCPFSSEIREKMIKHPRYGKDVSNNQYFREKQLKFLNARYDKALKPGLELDEELKLNIEYYQS